MGAAYEFPPPLWACDRDGLKSAVVRVVAREREYSWAAQCGSGADVLHACHAALDAWEALAGVVGVDVDEMFRAADEAVALGQS